PIAKDSSSNGSGAQYFHTDPVDSTRLVTDSTGAVVWQAIYSPFGQELAAQNNTIRLQYGGMEYDSETSLNHTDFRQYASTQGRWLTPDRYHGSLDLVAPQSLNRYAYVVNNPLRANDPSGLIMGCESDQAICESTELDMLALGPDLLIDPMSNVLAAHVDPD